VTTPLDWLGETEYLRLRAPREEELEAIADLWTDARATEHIGGPRDRDMILDGFREYTADPHSCVQNEGERWWAIIELSSGELVGLSALLEKEIDSQTETELGYFLVPAYWGPGYATEAASLVANHAFSDLELGSLVAVIDPQNAPSVGVARKVGLEFEREALRPDGVIRHLYRLRR
jgi:RimJ/RimL family protein N-acetyltransferase